MLERNKGGWAEEGQEESSVSITLPSKLSPLHFLFSSLLLLVFVLLSMFVSLFVFRTVFVVLVVFAFVFVSVFVDLSP